jgi:hypothetical protein
MFLFLNFVYPPGKPMMPLSPALVDTSACQSSQYVSTASPSDALELEHPQLSLNQGIIYSTVTLLARFLGLSMSRFKNLAQW